MKKKIFAVIHVWLLTALVVGWVWLFSHLFSQTIKIQLMIVGFVLAPLSEELFYRYVPYKIAQRLNQGQHKVNMIWPIGILANFFFIKIHIDNFPYMGNYFAFAIQGVMGMACYYIQTKYGYWASVLLHSKYNISLYLLSGTI